MLLAGIATLGVTALLLYGVPQVYRALQVRRWNRIKGKLALTYDDGPDDLTTNMLLDLLGELKAPATFYLVGSRGAGRPEIMARLRASGHELGTHAQTHRNAWKTSPAFDFRDAMAAYASLSPAIAPTSAFRPPFGKVALPTLLAMRLRGRRVDWWSVPINDHLDRFDDAAAVARRILDHGQTVVLMHCNHADPGRRAYMLAVTRELVSQSRSRGMELVTMSELAAG
jgi:peptidoglycan-N-acetylglucosamine deacetylase